MKKMNREQGLLFELQALELRQQGYSYHRIAKQLGVSADTVHNRLNRRSAALQKRIDDMMFDLKLREFEVAEYIQEEALEAWRSSRESARSERVIEKALAMPKGEGKSASSGGLRVIERQTMKSTASRDGNPAFLMAALAAGARIAALWGLDAPREATVEFSSDDETPLIFALPTIPIPPEMLPSAGE